MTSSLSRTPSSFLRWLALALSLAPRASPLVPPPSSYVVPPPPTPPRPYAPAVPLTLFRHRRRLRATPARERGETCLVNASVSGTVRGEEVESQRMPKFSPRLPSPPPSLADQNAQILSGSRPAPGLGVPFEGAAGERLGGGLPESDMNLCAGRAARTLDG